MWKWLGGLLAEIAEKYLASSASTYSWGEETVPECLRKESKE